MVVLSLMLASTVSAETIDLGFRLEMGTYTVPVRIDGLGEKGLTFDTGASLTVLNIEDVEEMGLEPRGRAGVSFPHQGVRMEAFFYNLPMMHIGNCTILNTRIIGIALPEGRPGVLGMGDLELLSPFTFESNGKLTITCPEPENN